MVSKREVEQHIEGIANLIVGLIFIFCMVVGLIWFLKGLYWLWEHHTIFAYFVTVACFLTPVYFTNKQTKKRS